MKTESMDIIGLTRPTVAPLLPERRKALTKANADLKGVRFGRLIAIRPVGNKKGHGTEWECKCDCGKVIETQRSNLRYGRTTSCGCRRLEILKAWQIRSAQ